MTFLDQFFLTNVSQLNFSAFWLTEGFCLKFLSSLIIKLSQEHSCISVNSRNLSESFRGSLRKKVFSSKSEIFREERLLTREEEKIGLVNFLNQPKQWQQKHSRDNMSFTFLPQKLLKVSNVRLKPSNVNYVIVTLVKLLVYCYDAEACKMSTPSTFRALRQPIVGSTGPIFSL